MEERALGCLSGKNRPYLPRQMFLCTHKTFKIESTDDTETLLHTTLLFWKRLHPHFFEFLQEQSKENTFIPAEMFTITTVMRRSLSQAWEHAQHSAMLFFTQTETSGARADSWWPYMAVRGCSNKLELSWQTSNALGLPPSSRASQPWQRSLVSFPHTYRRPFLFLISLF